LENKPFLKKVLALGGFICNLTKISHAIACGTKYGMTASWHNNGTLMAEHTGYVRIEAHKNPQHRRIHKMVQLMWENKHRH
jgi:hypothetical protein